MTGDVVHVAGGQAVMAAATVRVRDGDEVVGGGFLVAPGVVATCAHVVAAAIGADPYSGDIPGGEVSLDFPLVADGGSPPARRTASVRRWSPISADGSGDVALLTLAGPAPAAVRVPPLRRIDRLWDHGFRVLGFPEGAPAGVWSSGLIRGEQGTRWFQLQSSPAEPRVEGGFSGTPVWHEESGAVVGMTVAADRGGTTTAYLVPIDQVLGLDPELAPCPYRGLRPFDEEQAGVFFGRDAEIGRLADAVAREAVVAVAGPSGAGKSSLVRAGLLPRLRESGTPVVDLRALPGTDPVAELAAGCPPGSVVVIDQFEELAAVDPAGARAVLDEVVRLTATGDARAVLTVRWAALDQVAGPELMGVLGNGTVLVGPMDRGRLRDAIVGPAERTPGLTFEPGLVDRILDDAGAEPGRLPLVQALLTDLWDRREDGRLTVRGYEAAGGVAGAVAQRAERAIDAAGPDVLEDLRRLFVALTRPDRDGRFVRRATPLDQLPDAQRALVPALVDARLLVVGPSAAGPTVVELAHQALIDHWPRLRGWLDADQAFLTWQERVDSRRERWEAEDRADSALLRGATLAEAADWLPARDGDLAPANADYLRRSRARQRWEVRRWRIVAAVVAVLGLAAATLSVVTVQRREVLAGRLATATAGTLARESQSRLSTDPAFAARLALAAWHADPAQPDARSALAASYLALQSADAEPATVGPADISRLDAAGDTAIVVGPPAPVALTGVAGPSPGRADLPQPEDDQLALSPDGRWLADVAPGNTAIRLRDLTAPGEPRALPNTGLRVRLPRFSPDGTRLMWVVDDVTGRVTVTVWDLRSGTAIPHGLGAIAPGTQDAWLTPDPNLVLMSTGENGSTVPDSRLALRSLTDGAEVAAMPPGSTVVGGGAAVASCTSADAGPVTVTVRPIGASSASPLQVPMLNPVCRNWISADGGSILERVTVGDEDDVLVRIADLRTGAAHETVLPRGVLDESTVERFTVARDVAVLRTRAATDPPTVLLARGGSVLRLPTRPRYPADEDGDVDVVRLRALSADGRFVLGQSGDTLAVNDPRTGQQLAELRGALTDRSAVEFGSEIWVTSPEPAAWTLTRYSVPALSAVASFRLPVSADPAPTPAELFGNGQQSAVERIATPDGPRILSMSDGVLAVLDPRDGRPLHPPVTLGDSDGEHYWLQRTPRFGARPAHPGQAVVVGLEGELELWDAVSGRRLATVPTGHDRPTDAAVFAMDPSGSRLAFTTPNDGIEVWDLDAVSPVGPPIPAPGVADLLGFDADGYLISVTAAGLGDRTIRFVDVDARREVGSMPAPDTVTTSRLSEDRQALVLQGSRGSSPSVLPLTAEAWSDELCAMLDRPFTESERVVLPVGADTDRPCS